MCVKNGPLLRVGPFSIVRHYSYADLDAEWAAQA
jgi:protein-S-isoprenylcysteine O-methyltransferase Ste14